MWKFFKHLYLELRLYYLAGALGAGFIIAFFIPDLFPWMKNIFFLLPVFVILEIITLFLKQGIRATREVPGRLSNGDDNPIKIHIENKYPFPVHLNIIDEIPFIFQKRDFLIQLRMRSNEQRNLEYNLRPVERGIYGFGRLSIYATGPLGLVSRRYIFDKEAVAKVYPSFIQLRKFDLLALTYRPEHGIKKVRRIGHTMEFEQIKEYVTGDDIRTINWKATAKKNRLMVNQYIDERSQPVYSIIDKGRVMRMPFNGMSLLDYSINASLVISNVILKKQDKAGIFTFSKKVENRVVAEKRSLQMQLIMESLYAIDTDFAESDFSSLHADIKRNLSHRSLLFLYTNFETLDGLERQLPYLQSIANNHVLVTVFFLNTELESFARKPAKTVSEIYSRTIAERFIYEKRLIVKELHRHGIYALLTTPEGLTADVINKYLEFKARGII